MQLSIETIRPKVQSRAEMEYKYNSKTGNV